MAIIQRTGDIKTEIRTAVLETSDVAKQGGFAAVNVDDGKVSVASSSVNFINIGMFNRESRGLDTNDTGDGVIKWVTESDRVLKNIAISGLAVTDVLKPVYATGENTLVLTPAGSPIGYVKEFVSSGVGHVVLFHEQVAVALSHVGGNIDEIHVGSIPNANPLEGTSAIILASTIAYKRYKILEVYAICTSKDAGESALAQTVQFKIGATAITGGVITLATADTAGLKKAGTAITALNLVESGDVVTANLVASGTGATANTLTAYDLKMKVQYLPGA